MKKIIFFSLIFSGLFLFSNISSAEVIDNFQSDITINQDASINVIEAINYDFENAYKHGIFRYLPIKYQARGGNYNLRISNIQVKDEKGNAYQYETSYPGNNIEVKIGDPNRTITGKKIYVISYTISRAINYFDAQDELYWNVTGNDWPVAMKQAGAKIHLPNSTDGKKLQSQCYVGQLGSTDTKNCFSKIDGASISFGVSGSLQSGMGLTIVAGFPKGVVSKPAVSQSLLATIEDNWILSLPFITLIILFYLWYTRGRDPKGRGTIVAQYDAPDNLTPAEVGTLIDTDAGNKDISADIVSLAVRGYIRITRIKDKGIIFDSTDYLLEKLKKEDDLENDFEKKLMNSLFTNDITGSEKIDASGEIGKMPVGESVILGSTKLSDLKDVFYKSMKEIKDKVYETLVSKGYFKGNPKTIKFIYISIGSGIAMVSLFILIGFVSGMATVSLVISGILVIVFGLFMPARTKKGVDAKEYILGLKEYLKVAEQDRINFHNAPEKNPARFEKLLPYAMVLGVEKEWAKQFEGIYNQNPSWYHDPTGASFNSLIFVNNLNSFSNMANTNLASRPGGAAGGGSGFGGGGFSGGGFGGGGGGSW